MNRLESLEQNADEGNEKKVCNRWGCPPDQYLEFRARLIRKSATAGRWHDFLRTTSRNAAWSSAWLPTLVSSRVLWPSNRRMRLNAAIAACLITGFIGPAWANGKTAAPGRTVVCTEQYLPVCGQRGTMRKTYSNACFARADGAKVIAEGPCAPKSDKPLSKVSGLHRLVSSARMSR